MKPPKKKGREVTESIISIFQGEFLNHAIHVLELCKGDSFLRVGGVAAGPGLY